MNNTERTLQWIVQGLTLVGLIVATVILSGELAQIDRTLRALAGGEVALGEDAVQGDGLLQLSTPEAPAVPSDPQAAQTTATVAVAGVRVLTSSISLTVTVRAYGAGDLLFEPPVLQSQEGQTYPVSGESLEAARLAFLDLVTRGQAIASLTFSGRLAPTQGLWLVFNPHQEPSSVVAPPLRIPVPLRQNGQD